MPYPRPRESSRPLPARPRKRGTGRFKPGAASNLKFLMRSCSSAAGASNRQRQHSKCGDRRGGYCTFREPSGRLDRSAGRARRRRHGACQRHHSVADRLRSHHDPRGRQPPDLLGRQAAAPDADAGDGQPHRLFRRRPHQARGLRRVHAHRDAAARRRGRRKRIAARQAVGADAVGQRGQRAGRRLPARPGVPHDGRGRLAARARHPVVGCGHHRRGRGDAACRGQEHRHHRGRISRRDPRQDRRAVRRRLRSRPGASPTVRRPSRPRAARSA